MLGLQLIGVVLVFVVAAASVAPPAASAACIRFSTTERLKVFPVVFEATVTSARDLGGRQVLTVDVTRVWKGDVGAQRTLLHLIWSEGFPLVVGETYLMFASELTPEVADFLWKEVQLTGKELTVSSSCDSVIPIERAGPVLNELGPGQPSR